MRLGCLPWTVYYQRSDMKPKPSVVVMRPMCFLIALVLVVFLIPCILTTTWYIMATRVEHTVENASESFQNGSLSEIKTVERSLHPFNSSALNLARVLVASLNGTDVTFSTVKNKVAPSLFLVFLTIPYLSQISYIGRDGLVFSYLHDGTQILSVYSNTSHSSTVVTPNATLTSWYKQPVNSDTGKPYGEASSMNSMVNISESWFQQALNSSNGYNSEGKKWNRDQALLYLHTAAMDGIGVVSLGFDDGDVFAHSGPLSNKMTFSSGMTTIRAMEQATDSASQVYSYAIPHERIIGLVRRESKLAFCVLLTILLSLVFSISFILFFIIRAARREMLLRAKLIKQMEATQQAERKSMNKSLAFASASHDVRAALATITGLIDFCYEEVDPRSKLKMNLMQINSCVEDLLGILNSILDTSKVEAGKMQLVEDEFNLVELLEDVVDFYHNAAIRKGVDVVLDPCDDSIFKFSIIKGDRVKLKQILSNLLSNAVKFTTEGHVSLRVWVRKASLTNSVIASNHNSIWKYLSQLVYKNRKAYNDFNVLHPIQPNPNTMEFVFEVNDTGKGIPKEKQSYIFENFVQVKETTLGQGGHGLGLGIVQSLVRLMGGEIQIMDKEHGERGTCFRFNIILDSFGPTTVTSTVGEENFRRQTSKLESSHVVLLIQSEERRRICQRIIESLGITVSTVNQWEHLFLTLEMIKHRVNLNHLSSSGKSDFGSPVERSKVPTKDGSDFSPTLHKKLSLRNKSFILLVIDADSGPFPEMHSAITNFNEDLFDARCKVVWLDKLITLTSHGRDLQEDKLVHYEYVVSKPLHGSRLYQLLRILPEFGGNVEGDLLKPKGELGTQIHLDPGTSSTGQNYWKSRSQLIQSQNESFRLQIVQGNEKFFSGKKVLVAEDVEVLRKVAIAILSRLGATVDSCVDGEEALEKVSKALAETNSSTKAADRKTLPYDFIFMDCEMPIMNGYEASRMIRLEERKYGIHIPIVALTAHATAEEATKIVKSGMDFHLSKPLKVEKLLDLFQNKSL